MEEKTLKFIPTIGMETHVELKTDSKMFCSCRVEDSTSPNTNLCPTCLGLPGALPVPNKRAIEMIILIGVSLNCKITQEGMFHRKNYFYPDLPKNYQISQFDFPIGTEGSLQIVSDNQLSDVEIERVHMEEDTGKSLHAGGGRIDTAEYTLLDFNRSGIPLVEIVTKPVIKNAKEAVAYIEELRQLVIDLDISHGKLELGNLRFDANISVANEKDNELGVKVEIKNMNSLKSLERAINYEINRQSKLLEKNEIIQETRHWNEKHEKTISMRTKEGSADYRYFSDPDIPNMNLTKEFIDESAKSLLELPKERRERYISLGLALDESNHIAKSDKWVRDLFEDVHIHITDIRSAYLWTTGELLGQLRKLNILSKPEHLNGQNLGELISLVDEDNISSSTGKAILTKLIQNDLSPIEYATSNNLVQENDEDYITDLILQVLDSNVEIIERISFGEDKLISFLVGEVMKASTLSVNPALVRELIVKKIMQ